MVAPLTVYVMRHGEVENPEGILYGRMAGYGLSQTGRMQAQASAAYLRDVPLVALYSSPMQRARETADIINQYHGLPVGVDERINESYTPFDGTPHSVLEKTLFDIYTGNEAPYEHPADIRARTLAFLQEKRRTHAGKAIGVVTHGDVVVSLFMWVMGQDANDIGRGRLEALGLPVAYPATASVNRLVFKTDALDDLPDYSYVCPYE